MQSSNVETKREYKVKNLPKFFKERSRDISKAFSNKAVEISTIRSRSITSDTQELSFKLRLLVAVDRDTPRLQIKHLIDLFKVCLSQGNNFKVDIKVPRESSELSNNHCKTNKTVEEFISNAPTQILLQGITIALQTDVKDINLDSLHEIELFLNKELKHVESGKNEKAVLQAEEAGNRNKKEHKIAPKGNTQDKQIVQGSFGYNVASKRKQVLIAVAAMRENVSWLRFRLPGFFSKMQFFFQQTPEPSTQKQKALTYHPASQEATRNEVIQKDKKEINETAKLSNIGQTRSHTDYFKANRKKSKRQTKELSEEEKQSTIKQARNDARVAIIGNQVERKGKKLDEIFVEVVSEYKNQDSEIFHNIFNSVFNIVYFQDKQLHEVLESDEISEVLEILEIPQPISKSLCPKEYLQEQVLRKKQQLFKLVSGILIQLPTQPKNVSHEILPNRATNPSPVTDKAPPATNTTSKSSLKIAFFSKKACLFVVASSISILCLWHLPLGKVSILKGLVLPEKRESIGLVLNIGLPIVIALCILSLAYLIHSEYSAESIEQISKNDPLSLA